MQTGRPVREHGIRRYVFKKKHEFFLLVVMDLLWIFAYQKNIQLRPIERMPSVCDIVKGQANHVMRCLGKGHTESVYHRALITAMNKAGVAHRSEVSCPIWFMGECIGVGRADMVIDDMVLEIKANKLPPKQTSAQLQKYIVSLSQAENKTFWGMVVNFNQKNGTVDIFHDYKRSELFERSSKMRQNASEIPKMFKRKAPSGKQMHVESGLKRSRK